MNFCRLYAQIDGYFISMLDTIPLSFHLGCHGGRVTDDRVRLEYLNTYHLEDPEQGRPLALAFLSTP